MRSSNAWLFRTSSSSALRKIESGRVVEPGYFTMLSLANALEVDLHELG
jgi:hypothetical protein